VAFDHFNASLLNKIIWYSQNKVCTENMSKNHGLKREMNANEECVRRAKYLIQRSRPPEPAKDRGHTHRTWRDHSWTIRGNLHTLH